MKTSFVIAALASALSVHALDPRATACKSPGNNCQRGVAGTNGKPALSVRLADCSSFMAVTVTPATSTVYSTSTTTTYTTTWTAPPNFPIKVKRTTTAMSTSPLPTYATYCDNSSAYYSACGCAGVTANTFTAPTPTVTEVVATETVTDCLIVEGLRKRGYTGIAEIVNDIFH